MAVYILCYAAAFFFSRSGHDVLSGLSLLGAAAFLYRSDYRKTGDPLHLRGLFALSFVGGEGLACLKLSWLSSSWSGMTWLSFLAGFAAFYLTFGWLEKRDGGFGPSSLTPESVRRHSFAACAPPLFFCACAITAVSVGCFAVEAAALGYIPLFLQGVPHAYSYFHLTGIHYLTVSCCLVPALSVIYFLIDRGKSKRKQLFFLVLDAVSLLIPVLCVSRYQVLFSVLLAVLVYIRMEERRLHWGYALGAVAALVPVYVLLTVARSHDAEYLSAIFDMKWENMPVFLAQPYMYVANNYDNFDCLVKELSGHSFGLKMLAPLWTLTGLKFLFPALTSFPIFVTREEMTTLTYLYDAYYDFGLAGAALLSCLLGAAAYALMRLMRRVQNPVAYLLYGQFAFYMLLSFFTTWFSNPSTWFYLAVTAAAAFAVSRRWGA